MDYPIDNSEYINVNQINYGANIEYNGDYYKAEQWGNNPHWTKKDCGNTYSSYMMTHLYFLQTLEDSIEGSGYWQLDNTM